jgi:ATP-dependent protease ClpP protease subunit
MRLIKTILLLLVLATSAAFSLALIVSRYDILDFFNWVGATVTAGGFLVLLACCATFLSFALAYACWKNLKSNGPSPGRGLLFLVCAATTILQGCTTLSMMLTASDTSATYAAIEDVENAYVFLKEPGHVQIDGTIGANLFADVTSFQSEVTPITSVEINSGGGLVDQAMKLAGFVEKQKITVIVGDICMSACVLVAVASPNLTAHESSLFGFHQSAAVAETSSQIFSLGLKFIDADSDKFLSDHGIPPDIMAQAKNHKPDQMYEVKAADMLKARVVRKIIPDVAADSDSAVD